MFLCNYKCTKKSTSQDGTHNVHQQLLAGLSDAPESHVYILLAWQAIHTIIQRVRHCFGHLKHSTTLRQWTAISHSNNVLHNTKSQSKAMRGKHLKCKLGSQRCTVIRVTNLCCCHRYMPNNMFIPWRAAGEWAVLLWHSWERNTRRETEQRENSNA